MSVPELNRRTLLTGAVGAASLTAIGTLPGLATADAATVPTLGVGSRGDLVKKLQTNLNLTGFWCGTPDGGFGSLTQQAVWALQKSHGWARDGVVYPWMWSTINAHQRPKARYSGSHIEVNVARQLLMIVRSGSVALTINTSTGSGKYFYLNGRLCRATTPAGSYRIFSKSNEGKTGWVTGPLGSMYRPRYFTYSGIAVHGSPSIPPYPASHGCCRVSTAAQDLLLRSNFLAMGTSVRVY